MRLRKAFKNSTELVGRNADPCIADRKSNAAGQGEFRIPHHSHCDGPAIGKFDRVADEVNEDLVESVGSPITARGTSGERWQASSRPFSLARMARISMAFSTKSLRSKSVDSSSRWPTSTFDRSRMSLIRDNKF